MVRRVAEGVRSGPSHRSAGDREGARDTYLRRLGAGRAGQKKYGTCGVSRIDLAGAASVLSRAPPRTGPRTRKRAPRSHRLRAQRTDTRPAGKFTCTPTPHRLWPTTRPTEQRTTRSLRPIARP